MISVVIPLYNKEPIIERTIRSVLSQDYDDFEVVIVNDGSTDKSMEVLENALPRIKQELNVNTPVTIISQENGGPSKARNTGVKNAKGEWIVFLDADDELLPGALRKFSNLQIKYPDIEFFNCSYIVGDDNNNIIIGDFNSGLIKNPCREYFYQKVYPRTGSMMISKRIMELCPFDERLRRFEDLEILFRLYRQTKVYHLNRPSMVQNSQYAAASVARPNISEDYMGYLSLHHTSFWEKMCIYELYLGERALYAADCERLYHSWKYRYDLLLIYKVLKFFK